MFLNFLFIGTTVAVSANSWLTCWLGLEINLIRMIPLILNKLIFNLTEAAIKYFIVQTMASIIFIVRTVFSINFLSFNYLSIAELLIISALIIKAGIAFIISLIYH